MSDLLSPGLAPQQHLLIMLGLLGLGVVLSRTPWSPARAAGKSVMWLCALQLLAVATPASVPNLLVSIVTVCAGLFLFFAPTVPDLNETPGVLIMLAAAAVWLAGPLAFPVVHDALIDIRPAAVPRSSLLETKALVPVQDFPSVIQVRDLSCNKDEDVVIHTGTRRRLTRRYTPITLPGQLGAPLWSDAGCPRWRSLLRIVGTPPSEVHHSLVYTEGAVLVRGIAPPGVLARHLWQGSSIVVFLPLLVFGAALLPSRPPPPQPPATS